ncbi:zinc-binding dehydrogenase [Thermatribacter velox]|uniref:Zinc-binding dehydrogenase n=1 Tax=Thermatribacter velox TaxID=3039681 RepID=A0ABZ2YAR1_9BACT
MRGLKFLGNRQSILQDFPTPKAKDAWLVVKVCSCALCGSDLNTRYRPDNSVAYKGNTSIPGHEISGEVVEVDKSAVFKVGDRVSIYPLITCGTCTYCKNKLWKLCPNKQIIGYDLDGGCAEYVTVPEWSCVGIPPEVSYDEAALLWDPVGAPYGAIERLRVNKRDVVAVFGVGPMGLGAVNICHLLGATTVAIDVIDKRLELAKKLGADYVLNSKACDITKELEKITKGQGVDVFLECTGKEEVLHQIFSLARTGARCGLIGELGVVNRIDVSEEILHKDLTIVGSWMYDLEGFFKLISLLKKGLNVLELVTHRFPLEKAVEAWALFDKGETGKVIINP